MVAMGWAAAGRGARRAGARRHTRRHRPRRAAPPPTEQLRRIDHVVILIQENRSFDSYFGTLSGVRGFSDPDALSLPDGRSVFHQPFAGSPQGYLLPWRVNTEQSSPCDLVVDNSWQPSHDSWDGGRMDGFAKATGPDTMSYYARPEVPWHAALADAFTVCDGYFC